MKELAYKVNEIMAEMELKAMETIQGNGTNRDKSEAIADWKRITKCRTSMNEIIKRCGEKQNTSTQRQEKSSEKKK